MKEIDVKIECKFIFLSFLLSETNIAKVKGSKRLIWETNGLQESYDQTSETATDFALFKNIYINYSRKFQVYF